jgi:hypothetical protein
MHLPKTSSPLKLYNGGPSSIIELRADHRSYGVANEVKIEVILNKINDLQRSKVG